MSSRKSICLHKTVGLNYGPIIDFEHIVRFKVNTDINYGDSLLNEITVTRNYGDSLLNAFKKNLCPAIASLGNMVRKIWNDDAR